MGLFGKKKETEVENDAVAVADTDVTESIDSSRRFFVIIENVTTILDNNGSIVTGKLFGKLSKGDKVYVYQAATKATECEIQAIEAHTEDNKTSIVDQAEDTKVSLQLTLPDEVVVKKYAVVSNLAPQDRIDPKVSIENPAIAGIINGLPDYGKDNGYHATVAYWVSHGHFLTPIKMDTEPEVNDKGVAVIKKDTKIGFYMLKSSVKLSGTPDDKESVVLPLFTDWNALRLWEGLKKDGQRIHTQIVSFQDVYAMLKNGNTYAGIAINPFSKVPCTLPIPYLDTITNTPGYKNEFGPKQQEDAPDSGNVREEKVPAGKRILLGVPKETEEAAAIRQELKDYGASHDDIHSISFLTKIEEDTKIIRHLVVLEFPEGYTKEDMKTHMEAIYQRLKPLAKEINQVEYAVKGSVKAIDDVVAQHADKMLIYTA